jgi:hypothetical protein
MKSLIISLILLPLPVFANPAFKYKTPCFLETKTDFLEDTCTVVETREKGGALKTRNIYSNRFGLTIKGRFDPKQGYLTWDNYNNFMYKWDYKVGHIPGSFQPHSYVMPGFLVENISWD